MDEYEFAVAIIAIARNLLSGPDDPQLRGIFNLAGSEETNWAGLCCHHLCYFGSKRRPHYPW